MLSVAIFGGNEVDGSMLDPGERVTAFCLFGGVVIDFVSCPPPPAVDVLAIAIFGGVTIKVHPRQTVRMYGFSLFGGRSVEPLRQLASAKEPPPQADEDELDLPLEITAYTLLGGVSVTRKQEPTERRA